MHEALLLSGRHAIVTGGSRGIGAAVAEELARLGANVTIMGRTQASLDAHAKRLSQQYSVQVSAIVCDVTDSQSITSAFTTAAERLGGATILVNNAGAGHAGSFDDISLTQWNEIFTMNVTSAFLCTQRVLPHMRELETGRIINIASTAALKGYKLGSAYCASKHALLGMTRALALETARDGITVNAVCPSYTDTALAEQGVKNVMDRTQKSRDDALATLVRPIPLGRLTTPQEVAAAVAWLCSDAAAAVTGAAIPVAGGEVM